VICNICGSNIAFPSFCFCPACGEPLVRKQNGEESNSEERREKALECFQRAAEQGHAGAQNQLGLAYAKSGNEKAAIEWFFRAAKQEYADAQNNLGMMERKSGRYEEALAWFRRAAAWECSSALYNMGRMYEHGWGVERDAGLAAGWFRRAAEQGDTDSQFYVAGKYLEGGVDMQDKIETEYFENAARRGHAGAQLCLGWLYTEGLGVLLDTGLAAEWFEKAGIQGLAAAQFCLGWLLAERGGRVFDDEAAAWFQESAEQGYADAWFGLGVLYAGESALWQDEKRRRTYFRKATDPNEPRTQFDLGIMYLRGGDGTPRDKERAISWLRRAAERGYEAARIRLEQLAPDDGV
jgi:TPR repeat protein